MEDSGTNFFCPRLIDYIAIVGHPHPNADNATPLHPQILRRYPQEDHADFPLPPDTAYFCQPEGCTTIGAKHMSLRDTQSFVFALTEKDSGRRRYGTCLNFYRPYKRKYQRSKLVLQKSTESNSSTEGTANAETNSTRNMNLLHSHTLISFCIISHHSMFSTFRECLNIFRKLVDSCSSQVTRLKNGRRYKNLIWKFLIGRVEGTIDAPALSIIQQLETWIYRILSAPVPVPGKTRLELQIVPESLGPPLILALPDPTRFSLVDFPLHLPLELMGVDKCITVLQCIILEQKVLLMSRDYNALTMSVLALVAMLYPLEYMFPVIPLLPASLEGSEQLLFAPTPFIIGIPASFGQTRKSCLPNDVWLFDLDSDVITSPPGPGGELPPLPEAEATMLKTHLRQSLASMSMSPQPIKNLDALLSETKGSQKSGTRNDTTSTFNPFIYGNDIDSVDIATRVAMVRFFASPNILGHITEHTRILRLYPRPVVGFQVNSFIRSRPNRTLFICKLASTQAVEFFTEWSLNPSNVVHLRVQTGVYDPTQIGDKPRWYAHHQNKMVYHVLDFSSPQTQLLFNINEKTTLDSSDSDVPTSDSSDIDQSNQRITTIQVSQVFSPPKELHQSETLVAEHSNSDSNQTSSYASSDSEDSEHPAMPDVVEETIEDQLDDRSSAPVPAPRTAVPPPRPPPIRQNSRTASVDSTATGPPSSPAVMIQNFSSDIGEAAQSATSRFTGFLQTTLKAAEQKLPVSPAHQSRVEQEVPILEHQISDRRKTSEIVRQSTGETTNKLTHVHGENQVFLKETVSHILEGHGVSWLKSSRIRKLMEDENYRNFVLSRLNTQLDKKFTNAEQLIEDIFIRKSVYKGVVSILRLIIQGLEYTYKTNSPGGMASSLMVLEIAATHYTQRDGKSNNSSRANSPFGSRESLVSAGRDQREGQLSPNKKDPHKSQTGTREANKSQQPQAKASGDGDSGVEGLSDSTDEDIMHKLVTNKEMITPIRPNMIVTGPADNHRGHSSPSSRSPISYQPLKKLSVNSAHSGRTSPANSEAITNYSHSVALQNPELVTSASSSTTVERKSSTTSGFRYIDGKLLTISQSSDETASSTTRVYVFEALVQNDRSKLWDQMQFWEDVFLDGVAQERDIIGLDQEPGALMDRYRSLGDYERKHLEQEEDRLLSTMLYNLTSYMVMVNCNKNELRRKNRRLLGKSHIGLQYSQTINGLLDNLDKLISNDIDLKPPPSRLLQKKSFTVHRGSDNKGDMHFMEVCDDCVLLRSVNGVIIDRWWFERLVNMTYCPKTKVLCLWRKENAPSSTQLSKFYTKKCRELYTCIKEAMERAASRGNCKLPGEEMGGEFEAEDISSGKTGILQVAMDGISFIIDRAKSVELFVELAHIKKCFCKKGGVFIMEIFDPTSGEITQKRFASPVADQIVYSVLCIFSYIAAGTDQQNNITSHSKDLLTTAHHVPTVSY